MLSFVFSLRCSDWEAQKMMVLFSLFFLFLLMLVVFSIDEELEYQKMPKSDKDSTK